MSNTTTTNVDLVGEEMALNVARSALFAALTGAFAYVSFPYPLSPAPVTLQVLGVFLAGIVLGPVWGVVSMLLYLTVGAIGLPVFAGGGAGLGTLLGPTAGYLWSYPIAAGLIGAVVHRGTDLRDPADVSLPVIVGALVAGTVVIYALGVAGLVAIAGYELAGAVSAGALVFVPGEVLKTAVAAAIAKSGALPTR